MRDLLKMRNSILEDEGEGQLDEEKVSRFLQRKSISVKGKIPMIDQIKNLLQMQEEEEKEESESESDSSLGNSDN